MCCSHDSDIMNIATVNDMTLQNSDKRKGKSEQNQMQANLDFSSILGKFHLFIKIVQKYLTFKYKLSSSLIKQHFTHMIENHLLR